MTDTEQTTGTPGVEGGVAGRPEVTEAARMLFLELQQIQQHARESGELLYTTYEAKLRAIAKAIAAARAEGESEGRVKGLEEAQVIAFETARRECECQCDGCACWPIRTAIDNAARGARGSRRGADRWRETSGLLGCSGPTAVCTGHRITTAPKREQ